MPPLIEPTSYAWLFYVVAAAVFGQDVVREVRRRDDASGVSFDQKSELAIGLAGFGGVSLAVASDYFLRSLAISWRPRLVFALGIVCMATGGVVRYYAVRTLDQYFTSKVRVQDDQEVVDGGPYRWVRHPSYTGGLLGYTGVGIVLANWLSAVVIPALMVLAYVYRIRIEERTLREQLGEPYENYLKRTPYRLIPYVW